MGPEMLDYYIQTGFSIAVCVYLLYDRSRTQSKMIEEMHQISTNLLLLAEKIKVI